MTSASSGGRIAPSGLNTTKNLRSASESLPVTAERSGIKSKTKVTHK